MSFSGPQMRDLFNAGQAVGIGGPVADYTEGFAVLEELMRAVRTTMTQLETWMPRYLELWGAAFHEVRGIDGGRPAPSDTGAP